MRPRRLGPAIRSFLPGLAICTLACGDLWLEPLPPDRPEPACAEGEVLDPELEECVPAGCRSDDECELEQRCDRIRGICVPRCKEGEADCKEGAPGP